MDELAFAGVAKQAELVRAGEVSARELVELYLERIDRLEPELNAFRVVMRERALADADQADARRAAGQPEALARERPLLGVPIAVKDVEDVGGEVTRWGTDAFSTPARRDSLLVARLRAAGAIILGKTNLPELAIMGDTEGPTFGITRNPWDTGRSASGSSGGSGAAVAAGLCAAATASDGMGSIRQPAAWCGLVGLKPTRDLIPLGQRPDGWYGLNVLGFVTRTVADAALLTAVAAEQDDLAAARGRRPERLRVATTHKAPLPTRLDPAIARAVEAIGERLRSLGHEVVAADPPYPPFSPAIPRYLAGIAHVAGRVESPERLSRRTRSFVRIGRAVHPKLLEWARREDDRGRMDPYFNSHDVAVMPVAARQPVAAGRWEGMSAVRTLAEMAAVFPYCGEWNLTGQPAIAVPAGLDEDGLPLGVQLVGRRGDDALLLSLAAQLEDELGWADRRPPVS